MGTNSRKLRVSSNADVSFVLIVMCIVCYISVFFYDVNASWFERVSFGFIAKLFGGHTCCVLEKLGEE